MRHREHYRQYLHAYSSAVLGIHVSSSPDDAHSYAATALGVRAARKTGDFATAEEFCDSMDAVFAVRLPVTPAT